MHDCNRSKLLQMSWDHFRNFLAPKNALLSWANSSKLNSSNARCHPLWSSSLTYICGIRGRWVKQALLKGWSSLCLDKMVDILFPNAFSWKESLVYWFKFYQKSLQWRHNGHDGILNHPPHHCYVTVYSGADQRNIKAPHQWPSCGEFTGDRGTPCTNGQ